ncbi:hypothetical protein OSK38_26370, partial [Escherichia coli]|nr:hypothetical protein [Escherichia coli]
NSSFREDRKKVFRKVRFLSLVFICLNFGLTQHLNYIGQFAYTGFLLYIPNEVTEPSCLR